MVITPRARRETAQADRRQLAEEEDMSGPARNTSKIMIASLRYLDTFVKIDERWYFAERNLILDWSETRTQEDA
jgi:hypothetical protein